jgi:DNA-binding beta-propeller fold protein YncE
MPPDEPRIAWVQNISSPVDAGIKPSLFHRFSTWLLGANQEDQFLNHPLGVSVDDMGNFCVTDTGLNAVSYFDRAARHWYRWTQMGGVSFSSPVAVAKKDGTFYVGDSGQAAVIAFDLNGKLLFRIKEGIERPTGLAISGDRLLVADAAGHNVAIFDLKGKPLGRFGAHGSGPGEFNFPTHLAADGHGNIYVTDSMNNRIQVFDAKGNFLRQIGGPGSGPGTFSRPKGVAVDPAGRIYVVDALFGNVQIFDSDGRLLLTVGGPGSDPGEFWLPNGIAIAGNLIYVADTYNGRLQVFKYIGQP